MIPVQVYRELPKYFEISRLATSSMIMIPMLLTNTTKWGR